MRLSDRTLLISALGLAAGAGSACLPFPGDIVYEGACLEYSSTVEGPVCAGSFLIQERLIEQLTELMGIEGICPVRYSLVDSASEYCGDLEGIVGCNIGGTTSVYSVLPIHEHELVHAVMGSAGYREPDAFDEGFAEAFGYSHYAHTSSLRVDVNDILARDIWKGSYSTLHTMGQFIRFLVERHGLDPILEFMRCTGLGNAREDYAPVFSEVVGESLDDAIAAFADYPDCPSAINRFALYECSLAPIPWDEIESPYSSRREWLSGEVFVDCANEDVVGPVTTDDGTFVWTVRSFDIEEPGEYWLFGRDHGSSAGVWGSIRVTRCGSCVDGFSFEVPPRSELPVMRELPAGRYYVEFFRRIEDGAVETGLNVYPSP